MLLIMGGVSPQTCWASYKYGIIKFWYIFASCWIFFTNRSNVSIFIVHSGIPKPYNRLYSQYKSTRILLYWLYYLL
jgi:hypothetical protein